MSNINLVFFKLENSQALVRELANYYERKADFDVEFVKTHQEAGQFIGTSGNAIMLFKVSTKVDLQEAVAVLKSQKDLIKKGLLKPACLTDLKNKKVEKILAKYGCVDLLETATKAKTLSFKIDFWSRNVKTQIKKNEQEESLKLKESEAAQEAVEKAKNDFEITPALELESDIWITKSKADYKKVLRRWLIKMLGPSPHLGSWFELEAQPNDKLPTWKFVLKDSDDTRFISDDGAWFFYGSKPEFDWKINRWNFSSDLPHLYFYQRDGSVSSRFKFINGHVEICENSQFALTKEDLIIESCDTKQNFEADHAEAESSKELEGEDGNDLSGHLEGKGSTEDINGDPLSGKGSTDHLDEGPLSGKLTPEELIDEKKDKKDGMYSEDAIEGHMGGKSSTDHLDNSPLEGALTPGEEKARKEKKDGMYSEDAIDGHMGGKSSTDHLDNSPLEGALSPGEEKAQKEKKDGMYSEDAIDGHLGGKSSTDHLDNSPLDGSIKPGEAKAEKEKKDGMYSEDEIDGHLGGKSSTDHLDNSPLDGNIKPGEAKAEKEKKDGMYSEDAIDGHLGGKSSTDHLDNSPLDGNIKPGEVKDQDDGNKNLQPEDALGAPLGGKSSTEHLDNSPLDGNIKPSETQAASDDKNGSHSSDDLGGPLGGKSSTDHLDNSPLDGSLKNSEKDEAGNALDDNNPLDEPLGKRPAGADIDYQPLEGEEALSQASGTPLFEDRPLEDLGHSSKTSMEKVEESTSGSTRTSLSGVKDEDYFPSKDSLNKKSKKIQLEDGTTEDMEDALGGGLTNKSSIHNSILDTDKVKELPNVVGKKTDESDVQNLNDSVGEEKSDDSKFVESIFSEEPEDINLESGKLKVVLKQVTKVGNDITFLCDFDDFYEDELSVLAPSHSLEINTEVSASITLRYSGHKVNVVCKGVIEEKEEFDERRETLVISLTDINKEKYESFMKLYQERQSSINDFMLRAKGY